MEINDAEALSENYPSDFDAAVYLELHPVLMTMQILDYIKAENAVLKKTLSADSYNAKVTEDSAAFLADTASLHKLYVNPRYYGETEEKWVNFWVDKVDTIVDTIYVTKVAEVKLDSLDSAGAVLSSVKIYVDSVVMDSAGTMFAEIFGIVGTHSPADGFAYMVDTFSNPVFSILYLVWFVALWFHLAHGFWSAMQTLGISGKIWQKRWNCIGLIYVSLLMLGFAVVVLAFWFGCAPSLS